jgi:hypothetical protein
MTDDYRRTGEKQILWTRVVALLEEPADADPATGA